MKASSGTVAYGPATGKRNTLTLIELADRLRNDEVRRIVGSFSERRVAWIRVLILLVATGWTWFWLNSDIQSQKTIIDEAKVVFPYSVGFSIASVVWWGWLQVWKRQPPEWVDGAGAIFNFVSIWVLISHGFFVLMTLNALLPFLSIAIGIRFNPRLFIISILASLGMLIVAAPDGYWLSRPAYALYAIVLTVGLPLLIGKILQVLHNVSVQALLTRDAQSRFVAMMSHELRTPLNTLINASAMVEPSRLAGEDLALMNLIKSNANVLLHRVNEVLDVAAINGGRLKMGREPFHMGEVVRTVENVCGNMAVKNGISLVTRVADDVSETMMGDPGRIEQVLSNFVANGIKFTSQGGQVALDVRRGGGDISEGRLRIVCSVRDTGVGIPDSEKSRIFDAFTQISRGERRRKDGVGLGLFIAKSVSDEMRGELSVADNEGGGTLFTWAFELPLADASKTWVDSSSLLETIHAHRLRVRPIRCLVVDDNESNREIMGRMIYQAGHLCDFVGDGNGALRMLKASEYDLVLLDLHMPEMSGFDVLTNIHDSTEVRTPVVILSADSDPEMVQAAKQEGAVAYLTKPVHFRKLLDILEKVSTGEAAEPELEVAGQRGV
jgi:signal transduction histidine kinase/CheY-like chemotaxis protein